MLQKISMAAIIVVSLGAGIASSQSYGSKLEDFAQRQSYMPVMNWLNANAPVDCVVLVDESQEDLANIVPGLTHCNTYITQYTLFGVPNERIDHNFMVLLRLRNVDNVHIEQYLKDNPALVNAYLYGSIDQALYAGTNAETLQNIDRISKEYKNFYSIPFINELRKYRVDYVLTSVQQAPKNLPLSPVLHSGNISLYRLQ